MTYQLATPRGRIWLGGALATGLIAAGCGSSYSTPAPVTHAKPAAAAPAVRAPRLRLLSPRFGARTGPNLVVRVAVIHPGTHAVALRYVLDHGHARRGGERLRFRNLAPGRHHLSVMLAGDPRVKATAVFVVRRPAVPARPAAVIPAQPAPTAPAAPTTTAPPSPPPTATTPTAPPAGGIPQHNGGDGDSDNNGGPTDGDGDI